jgi:uncharacterized membrane protein
MLVRGSIIALLDPTLISLGSGRWTFQVLLAIGLSMICMVPLRRLPTWALLSVAIGWIVLREFVTGWFWTPPGNSSVWAAFAFANYGGDTMIIKYPLVPWLAVSILGWVFGRHLIRVAAGHRKVSGRNVLWICGLVSLLVFAVVRGMGGYGDMFLHRADNSGQQWLHVSKYPPRSCSIRWSLAFCSCALYC